MQSAFYSYQANEEDRDAVGFVEEEEEMFGLAANSPAPYLTLNSRDALEDFIRDYNEEFGTNYTTRDTVSFYNYYNEIAKRVKNREIDILLVVNMFLTGFDSKHLNTLYVDKNLQYHGLIQAYSRTNRILNELKSQGNIVCFRNLKPATDEAIRLFSDLSAKDEIIMQPYEEYTARFNGAFEALKEVAPTVDSVNELRDEDEELAFIKAFRELMRIKNVLKTFTQFTHDDLLMDEQLFEDYKSKYLDLYDKAKGHHRKEKVSILNDVDFEIELIHRDEINVAYILRLLEKMTDAKPEDREKQHNSILEIISGDARLRSKRELIEKFIQQHLPHIEEPDEIQERFFQFWTQERIHALEALSEQEKLDPDKIQKLISNYLFTEKEPLRDDIIAILTYRPTLKERRPVAERVLGKIKDFIETFIEGL